MEQTQRRPRRKTLTDHMVADLVRKRKVGFAPDPETPKFGVRIRPSGVAAYYIITRDKQSKLQKWVKVASVGDMTIEAARDLAKPMIKRVEAGLPPVEPPPVQPDSVADVVENFLKRHVQKNNLRTADEVERVLRHYVLPIWKDRAFATLKRSDIAALLDTIEDESGASMADSVLAQLRSVASFFAARNDDYSVPFIRGMRRTPKHLRARARILDDAELKSVWRAAEQAGVYGRMVRTLLLTAQRREKVVTMKWSAIDSNGVWTIETAEREKSNPGKLQLPQAVLDIIAAQPKFVSNPYVFAGAGGRVMANFSAEKSRLDKASGVSGWVIHDLRRTARSLMSRAGVNSDHAERVLGHAIGGVEQTYDRHPYFHEKADALVRLAALVELIINPPEGDNNVIRDPRFKAAS